MGARRSNIRRSNRWKEEERDDKEKKSIVARFREEEKLVRKKMETKNRRGKIGQDKRTERRKE